jgi:chemotaxis signal transduction protein
MSARLTAAELRKAFDQSFAVPIVSEPEMTEDVLAVRAQDHNLALRVSEIAGLSSCPTIVPVPGRNPALCGLANVRGALVTVYRLSTLVGGEGDAITGGWIVLCADDRTVALQFDELVGYHSVRSDAIHASAAADPSGRQKQVVQIADVSRPVISISDLLVTIRRSARTGSDKDT